MNSDRFDIMREIQDHLKGELEQMKTYECDDLNSNTFRFINEKLKNPSVRSSFAFWVYEYVQFCAKKEGLRLQAKEEGLFKKVIPFLVETVISAMYLDNQILDKKKDVSSDKRINNNLLASSLLKDQSFDYIGKSVDSILDRELISKYLREMYKVVNIGQFVDKNYSYNIYENSTASEFKDKPDVIKHVDLTALNCIIAAVEKEIPEKKEAVYYYFVRCYLISSPIFKHVAEMIITLLDYKGKEKNNIISFAKGYGVLLQIVNDNSDFMLDRDTKGKVSSDVMSDVKNLTMTLPIMLHLKRGTKEGVIYHYILGGKKDNKPDLKEKHNDVLKELFFSGALRYSILVGIKVAKAVLPFIKYADECPAAKHLVEMLDVAKNNRFYQQFYRAKKFYKKSENKNKLYECELFLSPQPFGKSCAQTALFDAEPIPNGVVKVGFKGRKSRASEKAKTVFRKIKDDCGVENILYCKPTTIYLQLRSSMAVAGTLKNRIVFGF